MKCPNLFLEQQKWKKKKKKKKYAEILPNAENNFLLHPIAFLPTKALVKRSLK